MEESTDSAGSDVGTNGNFPLVHSVNKVALKELKKSSKKSQEKATLFTPTLLKAAVDAAASFPPIRKFISHKLGQSVANMKHKAPCQYFEKLGVFEGNNWTCNSKLGAAARINLKKPGILAPWESVLIPAYHDAAMAICKSLGSGALVKKSNGTLDIPQTYTEWNAESDSPSLHAWRSQLHHVKSYPGGIQFGHRSALACEEVTRGVQVDGKPEGFDRFNDDYIWEGVDVMPAELHPRPVGPHVDKLHASSEARTCTLDYSGRGTKLVWVSRFSGMDAVDYALKEGEKLDDRNDLVPVKVISGDMTCLKLSGLDANMALKIVCMKMLLTTGKSVSAEKKNHLEKALFPHCVQNIFLFGRKQLLKHHPCRQAEILSPFDKDKLTEVKHRLREAGPPSC